MDNLEIDLAISISEAQYASFIEGDFKNGLSLLGEAEFINDRIGVNEMTPNLYYLISSVYKYAGQAEKAISYADRIFALENLGTVDKARAHLAKGIALLDAKKLDSVAYHLNLAGTYFTQLSNTYSIITTYNTLGKYYLNVDQPEIAREYFSKLGPIIEQVEYSFGSPLYDSYFNIGQSYLKQNELDSARIFFEKCIHQGKVERDLDALILYRTNKAYEALSLLDQKENNYKQALEHYKTYKNYSDTLAKHTRNQALEELTIKYETREKEQELSLIHI